MAAFTATRDDHREPDVQPGDPQQSPSLGAGFRMAVPVAGQPGMQIHRMRHHRRAQDGRGQQHAFLSEESRHQPADHIPGRRRRHEEAGGEADGDQQQQPGDHAFEDLLAALVLNSQQQQRHHPGDDPADQQR